MMRTFNFFLNCLIELTIGTALAAVMSLVIHFLSILFHMEQGFGSMFLTLAVVLNMLNWFVNAWAYIAEGGYKEWKRKK